MKIQLTGRIEKGATLVFAIRNGKSISSHPFFKKIIAHDQAYLKQREHAWGTAKESFKILFLPSGRNVMTVYAPDSFTGRKLVLAMRRVIAAARAERIKKIQVNLEDFTGHQKLEETAELMALQFRIANFEFTKYKTPPKEGWSFVETVFVHSPKVSVSLQKTLSRGKIFGEEVNSARMLSNTPGGDMTPAVLAREAMRVGKAAGFKVTVFEEKKIKVLKMGGVLGVAQGSDEKPKFIVMEYMKGPKLEKSVVLVGKGVTFDTGGLNIKTGDFMYEMHMDMSGGAAVIHILAALARTGVKKNIVGLVPAVENMPSGSSYRPGDVLKTMSGKTIEVMNTDAEGRVILADALTYAQKYNPRLVIDIATLTGAAEVALGQRITALFSTDQKIAETLEEIGESVHDFVWQMPLWEEYEDDIRGTFGDWANSSKVRYGGAITGAVFLWQFIKSPKAASGKRQGRSKNPQSSILNPRTSPPWVHLDIAPRMVSIEGDYLAKGAAGASIPLLTKFLREF